MCGRRLSLFPGQPVNLSIQKNTVEFRINLFVAHAKSQNI